MKPLRMLRLMHVLSNFHNKIKQLIALLSRYLFSTQFAPQVLERATEFRHYLQQSSGRDLLLDGAGFIHAAVNVYRLLSCSPVIVLICIRSC